MTQFIYLLGFLIWIFPAIRQYKKNLFFYFLILALSDPINLIVFFLFRLNPFDTIVVYSSYLLFLSILEKRNVKKYWVVFTIPLIAMIIIDITTPWIEADTIKFLFIMLHIVIFSLILRIYAFDQSEKGIVNWFYIVLLFYELTVISKFIAITIGIDNATGYFIVTTFVQIAFGLFFSIFREDDPRLISQL